MNRRRTGRACAALVASLLPLVAGCGRDRSWNVLLVTWDTTRADHLGCYGNDAVATPNADRLAREGVRFAHATSAVPMTLPSHSTIHTGLYPPGHGVRDNALFVLPPERTTLAEVLAASGWATGAAIGGFPLVARSGLGQGFELYDDRLERPAPDPLDPRSRPRLFFDQRPAGRVNDAVIPWLRAATADGRRARPFFLWVHYYDPHQPLEPPPPYDDLYATHLYDGEIAYADESLGVLLDELERLGAADDTLVVLTADHGEGLGEHGETTHSFLVYDATLHVPLIVRPPGGSRGRVVDAPVTLADVMPTILDLVGVAAPPGLDGRSLARCLEAEPCLPADRPLYAETLSPALSHGWAELRAWRRGSAKYIHGPRPELYDLAVDPGERVDLAAAEPARAAALAAELGAFLAEAAAHETAPAPVADDEVRARLLALGYLAGDAPTGPIREELGAGGVAPRDRIGDVALASQARQALFEGRPLAAREAGRRLLEGDPGNGFYRQLVALAEARMGRPEEALAMLDPPPGGGAAVPGAAALRLEIGGLLYLDGRPEEGLRQVRAAVEAEPTGRGLHLLAAILRQEGEPDAAGAALERALALEPGYAPARVDLAIRRAESGEATLAEEAFRRALADDPYSSRGHHNYAVFLTSSGRDAEALEHALRAVELDPHYPAARDLARRLLLDAGRAEEAGALLGDELAGWPEAPPRAASPRDDDAGDGPGPRRELP